MFFYKVIHTSNSDVNRFQLELRRLFNEISNSVLKMNEQIDVLKRDIEEIKKQIETLKEQDA